MSIDAIIWLVIMAVIIIFSLIKNLAEKSAQEQRGAPRQGEAQRRPGGILEEIRRAIEEAAGEEAARPLDKGREATPSRPTQRVPDSRQQAAQHPELAPRQVTARPIEQPLPAQPQQARTPPPKPLPPKRRQVSPTASKTPMAKQSVPTRKRIQPPSEQPAAEKPTPKDFDKFLKDIAGQYSPIQRAIVFSEIVGPCAANKGGRRIRT